MLNDAQISARKQAFGGSDAGAILGVNPYRGPLSVWARFHLPAAPEEENESAEAGHLFEDAIAQRYARKEGVTLTAIDYPVFSDRFPFMVANPDRLIVGRRKGLEVKTAGLRVADRWGEEGSNEIPEEYEWQVRHYLAVFEFDEWDLAVCIGGQEFRTYRFRRDLDLEGMLIAAEREFWERFIVTGIRPPVVGPDAGEFVKRIYPRALTPEAEATPEMIHAAMEFAKARDAAKAAEEVKDAAQATLQGIIGETAGFRWGGKAKATWTNNKDGHRTDWEAIAKAVAPSPEVLAASVATFTTAKPGARVLRVTV